METGPSAYHEAYRREVKEPSDSLLESGGRQRRRRKNATTTITQKEGGTFTLFILFAQALKRREEHICTRDGRNTFNEDHKEEASQGNGYPLR